MITKRVFFPFFSLTQACICLTIACMTPIKLTIFHLRPPPPQNLTAMAALLRHTKECFMLSPLSEILEADLHSGFDDFVSEVEIKQIEDFVCERNSPIEMAFLFIEESDRLYAGRKGIKFILKQLVVLLQNGDYKHFYSEDF
jgi:hypothetical protein